MDNIDLMDDSDTDALPNEDATVDGSQNVPGMDVSAIETTTTSNRERSDVWLHFKKYSENGKTRARCNACGNSYAFHSSKHGTTNLRKHVRRCVKLDHQDIAQMHLNKQVSLLSKKFDQLTYRELVATSIVDHNYTFNYVEHRSTRKVWEYMIPEVKLYTRNTAKADCLKLYAREKEKVRLSLERAPGRICLTSDCWSSITSDGYMCLTAHYVDEFWNLRSHILNFHHIPPPHTGVALSDYALKFLKEWGIEKKIFTLTLDNASNCDNMQEVLKTRLQNLLVCKGTYFHVRCSAHVLNLIVQDGLKIASEALKKIRESVKYVKGSEGRKNKFIGACEQEGVDFREGLRIDVSTRWSSTYLMLDCVLKYRRVFNVYGLLEPGYKNPPTEEEWNRAESICKFLKPFAEITTLISGSNYPTANLYFQNVWAIQLRLLEERESQDEVICEMAHSMLEKFEKYWKNYSIILAIAIVLDPRFKLLFVEFCYNKLDESTCAVKVGNVRKALDDLFIEYSHESQAAPQTLIGKNVNQPHLEDDISEFDYYGSHVSDKSELDLYLEERRMCRKQYPNLNILEHWKGNSSRYPILSRIARDIMAIPITTVASESSFSIGAKVLNQYRTSLTEENAEALMCTRSWLFAFDCESNEPSDSELAIPIGARRPVESHGSNE